MNTLYTPDSRPARYTQDRFALDAARTDECSAGSVLESGTRWTVWLYASDFDYDWQNDIAYPPFDSQEYTATDLRAGAEALCKAAYTLWDAATDERNRLSKGLSGVYTPQEKRDFEAAYTLASDAWSAWQDLSVACCAALNIPTLRQTRKG